ncbi:MAG: hypothetical protein QOG09_430 [Solirubrobacterales bacterium]|nr:hypothetical protein [Solirubrobacterales bacterium]
MGPPETTVEAAAPLSQPLRVLVVADLDTERPYGQSVRPLRLAEALAQRGCEMAVVGLETHGIDFARHWNVERRSLRGLRATTRQAAKAFSPHVIYAHQNLPAAAALLAGAGPVVADFHAVPSLEWRQLGGSVSGAERFTAQRRRWIAALAERYVSGRASGVIAAGAEVADDLLRSYGRSDVKVVPNGVGDELLARRETDRKLPEMERTGGHVVAVLPTEASPQNKQALCFLATVADEVAAASDPITFHILGSESGPEHPLFRYEGFVDELAVWLSSADACLLPFDDSARLFGGARNKLLEYLAAARRIVSTQEGFRGLAEAAQLEGVYLQKDDAKSFARGVVDACRSEAPELGSGGRDYLSGQPWSRMADDVADVLRAHARRG